MKKLVSIALVCALGLTPAAYAADSGAHHLSKLKKAEIAELLAENPLMLPTNIYDKVPWVEPPYSTGKVSDDVLDAAVGRLNALRRIAGLEPVVLDATLTDSAQHAAVLQAANGAVSKNPARPANMTESFYRKASDASAKSNLTVGYTMTEAMDGLMDDSNASNVAQLSHRRWQLDPDMDRIGLGMAAGYMAEMALDNGANYDYDFIAWPASGSFPSDLSGFHRDSAWSVSLNPDKYAKPNANALTVTVTRKSDGAQWTFRGSDLDKYNATVSGTYLNIDTSNYGVPLCIVFRPEGIASYEGVYTVDIQGLRYKDGRTAAITYDVDFFSTKELPVGTFLDVFGADYYALPILWAVRDGITTGTSDRDFSPSETCTVAQVLTFLYRAQGKPIPSSTVNPFTDVSEADYFFRAALWAKEMGLIEGNVLNGRAPCTRSMVVNYLWKLSGQPNVTGTSFSDVSASAPYAKAVAWAVSEGITTGTVGNLFAPDKACTRGQIVTFLYRAFEA